MRNSFLGAFGTFRQRSHSSQRLVQASKMGASPWRPVFPSDVLEPFECAVKLTVRCALLGRRRSTWAEHMRSRRRVRLIISGRATCEGTLAAAHGNVVSTSHFLPVTTSYGIDGTDDTTASCAESTATRPHGTHEHRLSSAARSEAPHTRSPPHHTCSHKLIHGCTWLRSASLPSVLLTTAHTEARANCHSAQSTTTGSHPSGTRFARRAEWGVERLLTSDVASP